MHTCRETHEVTNTKEKDAGDCLRLLGRSSKEDDEGF